CHVYRRRRLHRCSAHVTAKLTTAPMAASTAVLTMSCNPICATTLSSMPPLVPMLSCMLLVFIAFPFRVAHAAFHRLKHTQCQREVTRHDDHLGRQLHR